MKTYRRLLTIVAVTAASSLLFSVSVYGDDDDDDGERVGCEGLEQAACTERPGCFYKMEDEDEENENEVGEWKRIRRRSSCKSKLPI